MTKIIDASTLSEWKEYILFFLREFVIDNFVQFLLIRFWKMIVIVLDIRKS